MTHDLFAMLCRSGLSAGAALTVVLALRLPARRWLGAQFAYRLWLLVPISALAILLPAPVHTLATAVQVASSATVATAPTHFAAAVVESPIDWQPWLLGIWITGALALLAGFVQQQRRYLKNLGTLAMDDGGALRAETSVGCPALVGALRPRIVLPNDFESRYTPQERELVLVHERTHLARGDAQINALVALLRCLNWFNPLFHFAASRFRFDQELVCDALVVAKFPESAKAYANAMLKAQLVGESRQELRLPAGCYWPSSHPLKERIAMLKFPVLNTRRRVLASAVIATLMLSTGYVSWAVQPGHAPDQTESEKSPSAPTSNPADKGFAEYVDETPPTENLKYRRMRPPKYPAEAVKNHITAKVMLKVHVGETGTPESAEVESIDPPTATILADAAIAAALRWRFTPGKKGGKSEEGWALVPVDFDLTNDDGTRVPAATLSSDQAVSYRKIRPPQYPAQAIADKITGKLYLKVQIKTDGMVGDAYVDQAYPMSALALKEAAVSAVRSWQFNPSTHNGTAVDTEVAIPLQFAIAGYTPPPTGEFEPVLSADARTLEAIWVIAGVTQ